MIAKDIIYPEEAAEYGVVDDDGAYLDKEDDSGLGQHHGYTHKTMYRMTFAYVLV